MLKRLKVWTYLALATGASLYHLGCATEWFQFPYFALLREDLFG